MVSDNKLFRLLIKIAMYCLLLVNGFSLLIPVSVRATGRPTTSNQVFSEACRHDPGSAICQNQQPLKMETLIKKGLNLLMWFGGVIAVIMIIYAGYLFVRWSNEPNKVTMAKNIIFYVIVGLIVMIAANAIVAFVIRSV